MFSNSLFVTFCISRIPQPVVLTVVSWWWKSSSAECKVHRLMQKCCSSKTRGTNSIMPLASVLSWNFFMLTDLNSNFLSEISFKELDCQNLSGPPNGYKSANISSTSMNTSPALCPQKILFLLSTGIDILKWLKSLISTSSSQQRIIKLRVWLYFSSDMNPVKMLWWSQIRGLDCTFCY